MSDAELIQQVETFVRRLHDLEIIISPDASKTIYARPVKPTGASYLSFTKDEKRTFADFFAQRLFEYLNCNDETLKASRAKTLAIWIQRAYTNGFVLEGSGLPKKLDDAKAKIVQLEKDLQVISIKYNELAKRHRELTKHFAELPPKKKRGNKNEPSE